MHRQLDDDLRESEMEVLLNHTRHCPDCAAMFERLTRLSAELTSLPKVTPSYSLVDAIMPELLRIDNEAKQATSPAAPIPTNETHTNARRTQRTRRFPSWKSIGGVVAAGIVAGFFLITYPPQLGTSVNDSDNASIHNAAAESANTMKEPLGNHEESSQLRSKSSPGGDEAADPSFEIESGSIADKVDQYGIMQEDTNYGVSGSLESVPGDSKSTMNSNQEGEQEGGQEESNSIPNMGIAGQALFPSPDGQYVASIDEFHIVVSSADGTPIFKSDRKNGTHANLVWSPESSELTYDVSLEQGATEQYVIDVTALEERKAE